MGVVHGLEGNTGIIAVEIAVLHEVLDGIDDLGRELEGLEPGGSRKRLTFFSRSACSRRASNTVNRASANV